MGTMRRLALFFFGLSGVISLAALSLPWVGPWTREATLMLSQDWYFTTVAVATVIAFAGLLFEFLRALFTPSPLKSVLVCKTTGDEVTVSTAAISSQAAHIVEQDGAYSADKVSVSVKSPSKVRVFVRVRPAHPVDVTLEGPLLHDRLMRGLSQICGSSIERIKLEFVEPSSYDPSLDDLIASSNLDMTGQSSSISLPTSTIDVTDLADVTDVDDAPSSSVDATEDASDDSAEQEEEPTSSDITVPMPSDITVSVPLPKDSASSDASDESEK